MVVTPSLRTAAQTPLYIYSYTDSLKCEFSFLLFQQFATMSAHNQLAFGNDTTPVQHSTTPIQYCTTPIQHNITQIQLDTIQIQHDTTLFDSYDTTLISNLEVLLECPVCISVPHDTPIFQVQIF
jgi:hypothetical protein